MPLITSKQGWPQQPQVAVEVDSANPITDGILSVWSGSLPTIDLVDGSVFDATTGLASKEASKYGTVGNFVSGSNTGFSKTVSAIDTSRGFSIHVIVNASNITNTNTFAGFGSETDFQYAVLDLSGTEPNDPIRVIQSGGVFGGAYYDNPTTNVWDSYTGIFDSGTSNLLYKNGSLLTASALNGSSSANFPTITRLDVGQSTHGSIKNRLTGQLALAIFYSRKITAVEARSLYFNPWQILKRQDRRIWIPSAGGGGLSLTGSLTGQGSTLSATATNTEVHALSGALVGAGATLSGAATRLYSLTGSLTGQGATLSGSATTLESHAATGALVGSGSTLAATATNTEIHAATGALVGAGSALSATATNIEIHAATGSLIGSGSTLSGATTNTPLGINASGSLVGQGATLSATATNTEVHTCTGALYGQGATLSGALTRVFSASGSLVGAGSTLSATASNAVALFLATGALVGQGSTLTGSATNTETHAVSGSLAGQGSTLSATAALANLHTLSGSLVGSGSSLVGYASGPTTVFSTSPDSIVTVINKRNRVSVISRRS